jgi:hypothetical protein
MHRKSSACGQAACSRCCLSFAWLHPWHRSPSLAEGRDHGFDGEKQGSAVLRIFFDQGRAQGAVAAVVPPSPPVGGRLKADSPQALSADMQIEAIELASNFILKTSLRNPHVLIRAETPIAIAANGAAWKFDEAIGFVWIVPPSEEIKGLDVASAVVANDARDCKGKFASGRTSELVDGDVVLRGFSSCDDTDGALLSRYFIVSRRKGGFVMFSVVSNMKTEEAKTVTSEEKLARLRLRPTSRV